ncbi:hypothetical protein M5585_03195 [Serratia ureilytica]
MKGRLLDAVPLTTLSGVGASQRANWPNSASRPFRICCCTCRCATKTAPASTRSTICCRASTPR